MPYIANTDTDREAMLRTIGVRSMNELWEKAGVHEPAPDLAGIPAGRSELEVIRELRALAQRNRVELVDFLGGGFYDHFIPSAVGQIVSRGEFLTSYTPYQPEISQGTLQAIFEYQTAICRLTGMEVSNASLYDGGTALIEAIQMALRLRKERGVILAGTVSPVYRRMIETAIRRTDAKLITTSDGAPDMVEEEIREIIGHEGVAAVVIQYPDFLGAIHDWSGIVSEAKGGGTITICSSYPVSLSILKSPGEMGFDVVTGEGQSLGISLSFGGPYLGFMAVRKEIMRSMPGRICGRTVDGMGRPGFVLTLQAREQHIRREKATSNICTNEALCALRAVVFLSLLGRSGFEKMGKDCAAKAVFARNMILDIPGVKGIGENFFNEFVVELPTAADRAARELFSRGYAGGLPLGKWFSHREGQLLVAVTEKRTRQEIEGLAVALREIVCG